jgi:hypothetical protein
MRPIKLTFLDRHNTRGIEGKKMWINPSHIMTFYAGESEHITVIQLSTGLLYDTVGTPEDLCEVLKVQP